MTRPPRKKEESIFAHGLGAAAIWQGLLVGLLALVAYVVGSRFMGPAAGKGFFERLFTETAGANIPLGETMAFATLAMSQLVHAFNTRSAHSPVSYTHLASLTPSPVRETISPASGQALTMRILSAGVTRAYTRNFRKMCIRDSLQIHEGEQLGNRDRRVRVWPGLAADHGAGQHTGRHPVFHHRRERGRRRTVPDVYRAQGRHL